MYISKKKMLQKTASHTVMDQKLFERVYIF